MLIHYWKPSDALSLWNNHKDGMSQDLAHADPDADINIIYNRTLRNIYNYLQTYGTKLDSCNLPQTNDEDRVPDNQDLGIFYKSRASSESILDVENSLNGEQRALYDSVLDAVRENSGKNFFLEAPGGTGKTYLINAITEKLASQGYKVTACASSSIAARDYLTLKDKISIESAT